jgi:hypothetical protein
VGDRVRVIIFEKNCGQSAAMHAGIYGAKGDVIVTLDGDLQNDPARHPRHDRQARRRLRPRLRLSREAQGTPPSSACRAASPISCAHVSSAIMCATPAAP